MKKIKLFFKHQRSKILCTVLCVLLLIPCFSLYAFAAEDDDPSYTDSFTDVWTGVSNWIVQSIGSVQGVFYDGSATSVMSLLNPDQSLVYEGITFYAVVDLENFLDVLLNLYLNGVSFSDEQTTLDTVTIDNVVYERFIIGGDVAVLNDDNNFIMYINPSATIGPPGGLTFLGTLAVIAVAIALILLLIMVIHRFLALRS